MGSETPFWTLGICACPWRTVALSIMTGPGVTGRPFEVPGQVVSWNAHGYVDCCHT
jgi:hypothetical protein